LCCFAITMVDEVLCWFTKMIKESVSFSWPITIGASPNFSPSMSDILSILGTQNICICTKRGITSVGGSSAITGEHKKANASNSFFIINHPLYNRQSSNSFARKEERRMEKF